MKLDFDNSAHIKISLLSEGLTVDSSFFEYFTPEYAHAYYYYHKDNIIRENFPDQLILPNQVACSLHIDNNSSWKLFGSKTGFYIQKNNKKISTVSFQKRPIFYDTVLENGIVGKKVGTIRGLSALAFFTTNKCYFWDIGLPCKFCGLRPTRQLLQNRINISPALTAQLARLAFEEMPDFFKCILLCGGTFENFDEGFRELIEYVKALKPVCGDNRFIEILNFPPNDFSLIEQLKKAGAHGLNFAIEVANPELFASVCPGKYEYFGHSHFIDAASYASTFFNKRAFLNIVMGLDDKNELIDFMWNNAQKNITTSMNCFYPVPGALFHDKQKPSVSYIYDVLTEHQKIYKKYSMTPIEHASYRGGFDYEVFRQLI